MKIMKFGGSSVKDAEMIKRVGNIVTEESNGQNTIVVLSAMKGVTDFLIDLTLKAEAGDPTYRKSADDLHKKHTETADSLLGKGAAPVKKAIDEMFEEIRGILHGIELVRECSPRSHDLVISFGERLSCVLFAAYLNSRGITAEMVDAREIIKTNNNHKNAAVIFDATYALMKKKFASLEGIPVVTGFIASTEGGVTTTLGRNGSDYTASLIGAATGAEVIEIWTDVDGVLSADPRCVDTAFVIPEISIQEAMELSYFGAEVIHPYTMVPAGEHNIPIRIRNTWNTNAPGTLIGREVGRHEREITGIASIDNVSLINVEGGGMIGIPGIAYRVFKALAEAKVNIIMISQASSEHSICIVIRDSESEQAIKSLKTELEEEVSARRIQNIDLVRDLEIVAIIGENMRGTPGISGKLFSSLGKAGINVLAIAQGSSERNISFVVEQKASRRALNVIHEAFLH